MKCSETTELFSLYLDQFLDIETEKEFLNHIKNCPHCATELAETKAVLEELSAIPPVDFPSGLHDEIMEKINLIHAENTVSFPSKEIIKQKKATPFRFQNYGTLVAGLVLVLAIGGKNFLPKNNHLATPNTVAATEKQKNIVRDTSHGALVSPTDISSQPMENTEEEITRTQEIKKESDISFPTKKNISPSLNKEPKKVTLPPKSPTDTITPKFKTTTAPLWEGIPQERAISGDTPALFSQEQQKTSSITVHSMTLTTEKDLQEISEQLSQAVEKANGTILEKYVSKTKDDGFGLTQYLIPSSNAETFEAALSSLGIITEATLTTEVYAQYFGDTNATANLQEDQEFLVLQEEKNSELQKAEQDSLKDPFQSNENKYETQENETPITLFNVYLQKG